MKSCEEIARNLDKLRRNEDQMTPAQKIQYEKNLEAFKKSIFADSLEWLRWYLEAALKPCLGQESDADVRELLEKANEIVEFGKSHGWVRGLRKVLFRTYSLSEFLKAATPWQDRLRYEAYAPYWCGRCRKLTMPGAANWLNPSEGEKEFWWSDIFGMLWDEESGNWLRRGELSWRWGLPPTMELCMAEYEKEKGNDTKAGA